MSTKSTSIRWKSTSIRWLGTEELAAEAGRTGAHHLRVARDRRWSGGPSLREGAEILPREHRSVDRGADGRPVRPSADTPGVPPPHPSTTWPAAEVAYVGWRFHAIGADESAAWDYLARAPPCPRATCARMYQGRLTSISPRSRPRVNASPRTSTGSAGDPSTGRAGARVPPSGSRPRGEVNPSRRSDPSPPSRQLHTPRRATSAKEAALLGISGGPPRAAPRHRYGGPTTWARNRPCPPAARGAEPRPATCADAIRPCAASARRGEARKKKDRPLYDFCECLSLTLEERAAAAARVLFCRPGVCIVTMLREERGWQAAPEQDRPSVRTSTRPPNYPGSRGPGGRR